MEMGFILVSTDRKWANELKIHRKQASTRVAKWDNEENNRQNNDWNHITQRNSIAAWNTCIDFVALGLKGARIFVRLFLFIFSVYEVKIERW